MFSLMCAEGWSPQVQVQIGDAWADFVLKTKDGRKIVVETMGVYIKIKKRRIRPGMLSCQQKAISFIVLIVKMSLNYQDTIARIREVMDEPE